MVRIKFSVLFILVVAVIAPVQVLSLPIPAKGGKYIELKQMDHPDGAAPIPSGSGHSPSTHSTSSHGHDGAAHGQDGAASGSGGHSPTHSTHDGAAHGQDEAASSSGGHSPTTHHEPEPHDMMLIRLQSGSPVPHIYSHGTKPYGQWIKEKVANLVAKSGCLQNCLLPVKHLVPGLFKKT